MDVEEAVVVVGAVAAAEDTGPAPTVEAEERPATRDPPDRARQAALPRPPGATLARALRRARAQPPAQHKQQGQPKTSNVTYPLKIVPIIIAQQLEI